MSEDAERPAVDLGKSASDDHGADRPGGSAPEPDFDPYRFGRPDHPVPPEYAPPGYVPDPPASPYTAPNTPAGSYGTPSYPGPSAYGRPAWSPPPHAGYAAAQERSGNNGKAVAGLVLGIVSIVMFWLAFLNIIFLVLATIFGLLGMSDARARNGVGRTMALAGLICTVVGLVATTLYTVWVVNVANKCGGLGNSGDPDFGRCVRQHI